MSKLLPGLFPKGTGQDNYPQTPALPKLWNDWTKFEAAAKDLQVQSAKLVEHLGHCGACHTPRDFLGAKDEDRKLAGNPKGPGGKKVPNITPDPEDGIGRWRASDLTYYLKTGFRPDGDVAGGAMSGVIEDATAHLSDADRAAIAAYLFSLSPIPRQ